MRPHRCLHQLPSPWWPCNPGRAPQPPASTSCQRSGNLPPAGKSLISRRKYFKGTVSWMEHICAKQCAGDGSARQFFFLHLFTKLLLTFFACANFTSFTISANFRGTYIAAGSSKVSVSKPSVTFFAFLPKHVTFWRQSQTWSLQLLFPKWT